MNEISAQKKKIVWVKMSEKNGNELKQGIAPKKVRTDDDHYGAE